MATDPQKLTSAELLRKGMSAGVMVNTALLVVGLLLTPTTLKASSGALIGLAGALLMVSAYGLAGSYGPLAIDRMLPAVLRYAIIFGLIIGAGFTVQIVGEYLAFLTGDQASVLGLATFGGLFLMFVIVAALAAFRLGRITYGVQAAVWSALIGSFIWLAVVLLAWYVFKGTPQGEHVMSYEMYGDFVRSGETDYQAFIMGDMFGAAFFHSLLAPIFAVILGAVGGIIGRAMARLAGAKT